MSVSSKTLFEKDKDIIGRACCNCGETTDLEYHHIVPLSLGGNNILTNYCCLCYRCHSLLHYGEKKNISHSEATKAGIQTARLNGKQIGLPQGTKLITKKSIEMKDRIKKMSKDFEGDMTDVEIIKILKLSRNTYYKYKRELKV